MGCRNCNAPLQTTHNYCNVCGAKVIRNRLTLKNVWQDVSFQIFNLDNTFVRTFKKLFNQPQEVIIDYISGTRKRYMNPISYFAIAVTLSGLMFFVLRNLYHLNLTESSFSKGASPKLNFLFDYQAILAYLIMPLYALLTWMLFSRTKRFNYTEHLVANAFIIAQTSYVQVIAYILVLGLIPIKFDVFNFAFLMVIVTYQFYAMGRMHQMGFGGTFWRALIYLILLLAVITVIGTLIVILTLLTGQVTLEQLAPE